MEAEVDSHLRASHFMPLVEPRRRARRLCKRVVSSSSAGESSYCGPPHCIISNSVQVPSEAGVYYGCKVSLAVSYAILLASYLLVASEAHSTCSSTRHITNMATFSRDCLTCVCSLVDEQTTVRGGLCVGSRACCYEPGEHAQERCGHFVLMPSSSLSR